MLSGYFERIDEYKKGDPYPLNLAGAVVSSDKLPDYYNKEFLYYYHFYAKLKRVGNPFNSGWLEWPPWCVQLQMAFDIARETIEAYQNRRAAEEYEKRMTETRTRRRR